MVVKRFDLIYLLFVLSVPRIGSGNHVTNWRGMREDNETYLKSQNEAQKYFPNSNRYSDELNEFSRDKRESTLPSRLIGSLGAGILLPTRIQTPFNLGHDQGIIPIKDQIIAAPGAVNTAKYPFKHYAVNNNNEDKILDDLNIEKIPLVTLNPTLSINRDNKHIYNYIINPLKPNNLEKKSNLNTISAIPSNIGSTNSSNIAISNLYLKQNSLNENGLNNAKFISYNESNKTDTSLTRHKNDYFLKENTNKRINETRGVTFLRNGTNTENIDSASLLKSTREIDKFQEINGNGSALSTIYDKTDESHRSFYETVNETNPNLENDRMCLSESQASLPITEVKHINDSFEIKFDEKRNNTGEENDNENYSYPNEPAFKYPSDDKNTNIMQHLIKPENLRGDYGVNSDQKNSNLVFNGNAINLKEDISEDQIININRKKQPASTSENRAESKENHLKTECNENKNNFIQNYRKNRYAFRFPLADLNANTIQYKTTKSTLENHKMDKDNNLGVVYKNRNSDPSTKRNFKIYANNNYLNYGNPFRATRILYHCNQRSPLISCNGFYRNQNTPIVYPYYIYYPYMYRNVYKWY